MNFNSITSLLANDISPDEIVAQLEKHGPALSRKIKQMLLGGYGSSEILKFISKDKSTQKEIKNFKGKPTTPYEIARVAEMQNAMEVPKGRDQQALEELKRATPYVLGAFAATLPVVAPELGLAGQLPGMISGLGQPSQKDEVPKSLFQRLVGDVDLSLLDEGTQKQLKFLAPIAEQFEKKGKDEKSPEVKKLKVKISKILKGKLGFLEKQAMELNPLEAAAKRIEPMVNKKEPIINLKGMGSGMMSGLYEGIFNALKKGEDTFAGIKDPLIAKAKPYFDKGLINSPEDIKKLAQQGSFNQKQNPIQDQGPQIGPGQQALMQILQQIQATRGMGG